MRFVRIGGMALAVVFWGCGETQEDAALNSVVTQQSQKALVDLEGDEGTKLNAEVSGAVSCQDVESAFVTVAGGVQTTGSVDSAEVSVEVDGSLPIHIATIAPPAWTHAGRKKNAFFTASFSVTEGFHSVLVCFTQSGAQGRSEKKACSAPLQISASCDSKTDAGSVNDVPPAPPRDVLSPVTHMTTAPEANQLGWNSSDVTITLNAADDLSGVKEIHVELIPETPGAAAITKIHAGDTLLLTLNQEGIYTGSYFAVDNAGNHEKPVTFSLKLDKTAPVVNFETQNPAANAAGWNNTDVAIPFTVVDALSGVSAATGNPLVLSQEGNAVNGFVAARDVAGNTVEVATPTARIDKTAPVLSGLPGTCSLWPPNHQLVTVANLTGSDTRSGLPAGALVIRGSSNEPENGLGDGDTGPDIFISGGTVNLRAERSGKGTGRIYTVASSLRDAAGNIASAQFQCMAPHSKGK